MLNKSNLFNLYSEYKAHVLKFTFFNFDIISRDNFFVHLIYIIKIMYCDDPLFSIESAFPNKVSESLLLTATIVQQQTP